MRFHARKHSLDPHSSPDTRPDNAVGVSDGRSADGGNPQGPHPSPRVVTSVSTTPGPSSGVVHDLNVASEHQMHDTAVLMAAVTTIVDLTATVIAVRAALDDFGNNPDALAITALADIAEIVGY